MAKRKRQSKKIKTPAPTTDQSSTAASQVSEVSDSGPVVHVVPPAESPTLDRPGELASSCAAEDDDMTGLQISELDVGAQPEEMDQSVPPDQPPRPAASLQSDQLAESVTAPVAQQQPLPQTTIIKEKVIHSPFVGSKPVVVPASAVSATEVQPPSSLPQEAPMELSFGPRKQNADDYSRILRNVGKAMRQAHDNYLREFESIRSQAILPKSSDEPSAFVPIKRNPAPSDVFPLPPVTAHSSFFVNQNTVEELTAMQLQSVFRFIRCYETDYMPPSYDAPYTLEVDTRIAILSIINSMNLLERTSDNAIKLIKQLADSVAVQPYESFSFTVLTAWAQEIIHSLTAMSVHRDIIQEAIIPCFADDRYRDTLQGAFGRCYISTRHVGTLLARASGLSAFLTRYLRAIEVARMLVVAKLPEGELEAQSFIKDIQQSPPGQPPTSPALFTQTLQWWRDNYSQELQHQQTQQLVEQWSAHVSNLSQPSPANPPPVKQFKSGGFDRPSAQPSPAVSPSPKQTDWHGFRIPKLPKQNVRSDTSTRSSTSTAPTSSRAREDGPRSRKSRSRKRGREQSRARTTLSEPERRRYRYDERSVQSPLPPWVEPQRATPRENQPPCIFCSHRDHYSAECHYRRRLSERADLLRDLKICSNCLKDHYGVCSRREACLTCAQRGHHQAICVHNRYVEVDITTPAVRFYEDLARDTYVPGPGEIRSAERSWSCGGPSGQGRRSGLSLSPNELPRHAGYRSASRRPRSRARPPYSTGQGPSTRQ